MKKFISIIACISLVITSFIFANAAYNENYDPEFYKNMNSAVTTTSLSASRSAASSVKGDIFTGNTYTHASKYKSGYTIRHGIDVSEFQGAISVSAWKKAKSAGVEFAIIRVAYRGYGSSGTLVYDKFYKTNIENAISAGLPVGVYIYSQAVTTAEAVAEANTVLKVIGNYNLTLPVVLDYEYASTPSGLGGRLWNAKLSKTAKTNIVNAFCSTVIKAGYTPMVYANANMLANDMNASSINGRIWLAHYTTKTNYSGNYDFWQYSSAGKVNGIPGDIDVNFWYDSGLFGTEVNDVKFTARSKNALRFTWSAPKKVPDGCTLSGYNIYKYSSTDKLYHLYDTVSADTLLYTVTGLNPTTRYLFTIEPVFVNSLGEKISGMSTAFESVTKTADVTGIKTVSTSSSAVKFSWTPVNKATGYVVYKYDTASKTYKKLSAVKATQYTATSLSANGTYKFKIRAYRNYEGVNYYSDYSSEFKALAGPAKVTGLKSTALSSTKIKLSWSAAKGAQGYQVYKYDTASKTYKLVKTVSSSKTRSYTATVKKRTKVKYKVRAYKKSGTKVLAGTSVQINTVGKSTGKVTASKLNVRKSASSKSAIRTKLKRGSKVTVTGSVGTSWYKISYKKSGKTYTGYVSQKYIKIV